MRRFDIQSIIDRKKVICYGAGFAFLSTVKEYDLPVTYIVDDTPHLQGQYLNGIPIYPSHHLLSENKDEIFVVICANTAKVIQGISSSLNLLGFNYGAHYSDCSFLHYESMSVKLRQNLNITPRYDKFCQCRLLSLHSSIMNLSTAAGTWLFIEIIDALYPNILGDVVECGVYQGANAFISLILSSSLANRTYHLFDSFGGFPRLSNHDPISRQHEFDNIDFISVRDTFQNFDNVIIHKGFFEETLSDIESSNVGLVYIDCDLYEPTLYCIDFFYNKLPIGGCMLIHDYWIPDTDLPAGSPAIFSGVYRAVHEFFGKEDIGPHIIFPETTHVLIMKK